MQLISYTAGCCKNVIKWHKGNDSFLFIIESIFGTHPPTDIKMNLAFFAAIICNGSLGKTDNNFNIFSPEPNFRNSESRFSFVLSPCELQPFFSLYYIVWTSNLGITKVGLAKKTLYVHECHAHSLLQAPTTLVPVKSNPQ